MIFSEWEVTDLGEPTKIVGIEITQTKDAITISQKAYLESILQREGLQDMHGSTIPMDPNIKLEPNPDGNPGNRSNSFARLLGELQFLANSTRPDIAFAVNKLAAYTANPSLQHFTALKRILRYLAGTKTFGITYSKISPTPNDNSNIVYGFADAAFANYIGNPRNKLRLLSHLLKPNMSPYLKPDAKLSSSKVTTTVQYHLPKIPNFIIEANILLSDGIGSENSSNIT